MSRLPSANSTGVPPPTKLLKRQPSLDLRRKKQTHDPPLPPLKASKSASRMSRTSISSYEELDSPSSRFSSSSFGSNQTAMTSPRNSVTSPKPSGPRKRLSVKPPPIPPQHLPQQQQKVESYQDDGSSLYIGERVVVDSMNIVGTLKFIGVTRFKPGTWAGIELDIVGTGKNDGCVQGLRYFSCPPETVAPLDRDDMSIRSLSPPSPYSSTAQPSTNGHTVTRVTKGSRAERYVGLTAQQQQQQVPQRRATRTPTSSSASTSRRSQPTPTASTSSSASAAALPGNLSSSTQQQHHTNHHGHMDDYYAQEDSLVISDEHMLTDTPVPVNLAMSESTDTPSSLASTSATSPPLAPPSSTSTTSSNYQPSSNKYDEDSQARLERMLGEAIAQAPDEGAMRLQQLQLRVEYLKLENTQNKTAEQILERSMVLKKMNKKNTNGDGEDGLAMADDEDKDSYFTLEGHKAIVEEIKQDHETKQKAWVSDMETVRSSIKKLENRVFELETEQSELIKERDELLTSLGDARKAKNQMESKVQELEQKVAVAEANAAAALASRTVQTTANFYSQDPEEMQERQRQMEMEMEEVHDKMTSLMDAMRAKDMFLTTLSEQVEQHRNLVEEKERELRRVRMEGERHNRDKERLREEIQDLEAKWVGHEGCVTKEEFDSIKRDHAVTKEHLAKETATVDDYKKRIHALEETVDELKVAGMESIELYENSVELHRVAMETINANLQDEQHKVSALELEKAHLVKTGADALDTFEHTMEALKQQHLLKVQAFDTERKEWEETIAKLKDEIAQLVDASNQTDQMDNIKQVWDSERQRLEEAIERHNQQLTSEQAAHQSLKQHADRLEEQVKQADKLGLEKQQLEEQVQQLQGNYDEQLQSRGRYLDEVRTAMEAQKKTQGELRRLTEAKEKTDRELTQAHADLAKAESTLTSLRSSSSDMDGWIKEKQQQAKDMEMLRDEVERLEAQNAMLTKQKESAELAAAAAVKKDATGGDEATQALVKRLQKDNKRLVQDQDKLKEANKQMETECLKLMDEVEKLHSEGPNLPTPPSSCSDNDSMTPDEKMTRLDQQLAEAKRHMEKLLLKHASEIQQVKDQQQEADRKHQREVSNLNRDVTELEGIIEAKIFKEADLEEALENEHMPPSTSTSSKANATLKTGDAPYCELCEQSGHDLLSCKTVLNESSSSNGGDNKDKLERPFCQNCDEHGLHNTSDCPNQNETY
ncbi:hypothetical protein BCR42DRAFT_401631 [Absidia repens]|uniref:CAP-Gly domain-containing protein n=1 Tax=Absidia repens TaxID=90262 RepID=A0A1X2J2V9_9FUNG|nr:hypothetical protein BCR42DRAFT_401631 [Absidia repens]